MNEEDDDMASKIFDKVWLHDCLVRLADSIASRRDKGAGTPYLCVLYLSENKQRPVPLAA